MPCIYGYVACSGLGIAGREWQRLRREMAASNPQAFDAMEDAAEARDPRPPGERIIFHLPPKVPGGDCHNWCSEACFLANYHLLSIKLVPFKVEDHNKE